MTNFKQLLNKAGFAIKKNSPAILTSAGIVGLGATAYLAYRSRHKVEEVLVEVEEAQDRGETISKVEVAKDLTKALYLPVITGTVSIVCITASFKIQNNRIAVLAGALATQQAQNMLFEKRYKEQHGEEAYVKFVTPTETVEETYTDNKGKEKVKVSEIKSDIDKTIGQWYDESTEYTSDDHSYNLAYIDSVNERLQTILFQRGTLLLNEVRDALGFERIRAGQILGWTTADGFDVEKTVSNLTDMGTGDIREQIYVSWTRPRYIYDEVEFNGRYSIN